MGITVYPPQFPIQSTAQDGSLTSISGLLQTKELRVADTTLAELLANILLELKRTNLILQVVSDVEIRDRDLS